MTTPEKRTSRATTETRRRQTPFGRSRRRRPIASPSPASASNAIIDLNDEKENRRTYASRRSNNVSAITTPIKRSSRDNELSFVDDCDDELGSFNAEKTYASTTPQHKDKTRQYERIRKEFQNSLQRISVSSTLWEKVPDLANALVRVSLSGMRTTESLGLEGHASALISLCRKLIRDVSIEAADDSDTKHSKKLALEHNLFVAVHVLRSLAFLFADSSTIERKEGMLKMFFHLITCTNRIRSNSSAQDQERCQIIALAGYEGLAEVLSHYCIQQKLKGGSLRTVSFRLGSKRPRLSDDRNERSFCVIPSTNSLRISSLMVGTMSVRQLSTIAFQTTLVVVKALLALKDSMSVPYINFGHVNGGSDGGSSFKMSCLCHRIALELLQRFHRPWLMLLASDSISETGVVTEILSYSKNIHRILWDAASTLKLSSSPDTDDICEVETDCLELRKQAIFYLLASSSNSEIDLLIRNTSLENGCSYAWKAASVFVQHLASDSTKGQSFLSNFYEDLDSVFSRLIAMDPAIPLGFIEYRAQRSIHFESTISMQAPTIHSFLPFHTENAYQEIQENEISDGNFRILLHIIELGISSKTKIHAFISDSKHIHLPEEHKTTNAITIQSLEKLSEAFSQQVTRRLNEIPSDVMNRMLKILCNLSLHKTLFLATKYCESNEWFNAFLELETDLVVAATVLTECLGPLLSAILKHKPKRAPQLVDMMIECFLRPLYLFEQLHEAYSNIEDAERIYALQRYRELSMTTCKRMIDIFENTNQSTDFNLPIQCLEKVAKSLYAIARQRKEKSQIEDSIPPLLYSLKIYNKLDSLNGRKKDYQLSSRLFMLSSTLESMGKLQEYFNISCSLVNYELEKYTQASEEAMEEESLLNYLATKSCGLLPPSTDNVPQIPPIVRSVCRQMATHLIEVEAFEEVEQHRSTESLITIASTIESFLKLFSSKIITNRSQHPLDSIQRLLDLDRNMDQRTNTMKMIALTEILVDFGQCIQQFSRTSELNESQLESAVQNYFYLHSFLRQTISHFDIEHLPVFDGLLGLVTSASIVPSFNIVRNAISIDWKNGVNPLLVDTATEIVNESIEALEGLLNRDGDMSWMLLSESLRIVLQNLSIMLKQATMEAICDYDFLTDCVGVVERLVDAERACKDSDVILRARHWAIWAATFLRNELEIRGDHDRAAIVSLWILALAEKIEPHQPWFHALAMTACAKDGNLLRLNKSLVPDSFYNNATNGSAIWMFEKELQLCEIRIALSQSLADGEESFRDQIEKVECIQSKIEEYTIDKNDNLFVLHTWVRSSIFLVQTDIASAFGQYTTALKMAQMCQKCCQTILKRVSIALEKFDNWMSAIVTSTVLAMATQRYIEILSRRPRFHYRLGDHRKALAYTRSILEYLEIDPDLLTSGDGKILDSNDLTDFLEVAPQVRLFLQMNSWASTPETTMQEFTDIKPQGLNRHSLDNLDQPNASLVNSIQDMIAIGDILYGDSLSERFQQKSDAFYEEAAQLMTEKANLFKLKSLRLPSGIERHLGIPVANQVKLRDVRRLLQSSDGSDTSIRGLCAQIEESEFSCPEDKAWSLYYLGTLELEDARSSGVLRQLWNDQECGEKLSSTANCDENICSARYYLSRALLYSSETSDVFSRKILRSLALAEGPLTNNGIGASAGILILRSIGQSTRRRLTWSFDQGHDSSDSGCLKKLKDIFSVFDGLCKSDQERDQTIEVFLEELAARTPEKWSFIAPVICPSGEMLVTMIQKGIDDPLKFTITTRCIFPPKGENAYDTIMKPLDDVLAQVHEQLQGVNQSHISKSDDKEAIKRKWWDDRNRLDAEMCNLLENVESLYFSNVFNFEPDQHNNMKGLLGNTQEQNTSQAASPRLSAPKSFTIGTTILKEFDAGWFEGEVADFDANSQLYQIVYSDGDSEDIIHQEVEECRKYFLAKMTVPQLKARLISAGATKSQFRKLKKADLIEMLIKIEVQEEDNKILLQPEEENLEKEQAEDTTNKTNRNESTNPENCIFLILDENLHRFPFEGMPILRRKTVCRVPCLSFVLATLIEHECSAKPFPFVDPTAVSYVLNPESNLEATQDRILPIVQGISSTHRWDWDGVVGEIPPPSFFSTAYGRKGGLTMYFGHGGAQVCFSRRNVEKLIEGRVSSRTQSDKPDSCRSAILLMGCSSGKLISINRKHSISIEETPLYYEPEGIALSYLCAGAPCVIGNLWDVTDNDIDRFAIALMENFFENENTNATISLAKSLSISRSVCKLKHLVGCAPVCYGVPVYLKQALNREVG